MLRSIWLWIIGEPPIKDTLDELIYLEGYRGEARQQQYQYRHFLMSEVQ